MKKLTLLLMLALSFSQSALSLQYSKADSLKVVSLFLQADSQKFNNIQERTLFFARKLIGIPYVASTLEVNRKEQLVVNLRQLDCTTFVENSLALALTHQSGKKTLREFCKNLQTLRYRGGKDVSYIGRLHYFTEWIEDNTRLGICKEIQSPNPPFTMIQHVRVDYMSRRDTWKNQMRPQLLYSITQDLSDHQSPSGRRHSWQLLSPRCHKAFSAFCLPISCG